MSSSVAPSSATLNPPSLPELAYEHLRDSILKGALEAGAPLRQEEIAARLGISRLPIREALRRLESEGLAMLRPRRGYVVASLNREEIDDVLDLQATLEARAGHAATLGRSEFVTRELEHCLEKLDRITSLTPVDVDAFAELNLKFHDTLFESSGRPFLCRTLRQLRANAERYVRVAAGVLVDLRQSQAEHRAILDAYKAGDAATVAELCWEHRDATRTRLLEHLDRTNTDATATGGA